MCCGTKAGTVLSCPPCREIVESGPVSQDSRIRCKEMNELSELTVEHRALRRAVREQTLTSSNHSDSLDSPTQTRFAAKNTK